ncbi:hypothetical protein H112_01978 [Trichophyton rubrum D6]|uniref:Uncharacterized protein n=2 Tax=Trichophyton TaxID=5550 RepID=A0A022WAU2_TRIRU|nr:hypothetical protein H100_01974 [Trichophyton rubrum MR850]EZF44774.1 hypothetical protein H102_01973 [Trichophyton rubrum CBS 100081]EZF55449.1 hypothetical protein H103_01984 [Trichophyton rubrum CBS 288.86]EZF66190.1 hypothetical protein H104_01959 [Trichophyton rubrum CBS 289.86]EZF76811.1 hypothetical protein H105_01989 [Trichophyton soudanense CBS 452.61]EZF87358.1 hypothetical protein H110_01983 [Trichophyton rubrum MR1448]EZF98137.1 hypothetical protein H113_01981 [Trichophyton rub
MVIISGGSVDRAAGRRCILASIAMVRYGYTESVSYKNWVWRRAIGQCILVSISKLFFSNIKLEEATTGCHIDLVPAYKIGSPGLPSQPRTQAVHAGNSMVEPAKGPPAAYLRSVSIYPRDAGTVERTSGFDPFRRRSLCVGAGGSVSGVKVSLLGGVDSDEALYIIDRRFTMPLLD